MFLLKPAELLSLWRYSDYRKSSFNLFFLSFNSLRKVELLKSLTVRLFQPLSLWKGSSLHLVPNFNVDTKDAYCMTISSLLP